MIALNDGLRLALAPTGNLRVAINYGNPILAARSPASDEPVGVSVDIARRLAQALNLDLQLITVDTAGLSVKAVEDGLADVGFFAIDPVRAAQIQFTSAYLIIEGCYLVHQNSPTRTLADVDAPGQRIAVGRGSAYDLFLTREIRQASLVRAPSSPAVVETFLEQGLEVAAGVRQQLEADQLCTPGLRLIDEPFMQIHQAMGLPRVRGEQASAWLQAFIDDLKRQGFIQETLTRHGITGVTAVP